MSRKNQVLQIFTMKNEQLRCRAVPDIFKYAAKPLHNYSLFTIHFSLKKALPMGELFCMYYSSGWITSASGAFFTTLAIPFLQLSLAL